MPRQSLGIVSSLTDDDWLRWWDVNVRTGCSTARALRCD
jgi:3-oxoacyl-[acyl-carrier protein] reductase